MTNKPLPPYGTIHVESVFGDYILSPPPCDRDSPFNKKLSSIKSAVRKKLYIEEVMLLSEEDRYKLCSSSKRDLCENSVVIFEENGKKILGRIMTDTEVGIIFPDFDNTALLNYEYVESLLCNQHRFMIESKLVTKLGDYDEFFK